MEICNLDTTQDSEYNLYINRNRTLDQVFDTYFLSGTTEIAFNFSGYTGASLQVRKDFNSDYVLIEFTTDDNSIVLSANSDDSKFKLVKTAEELKSIRAGEYKYDMYLTSASAPKRAFMSGNFILKDFITT